MAKARDCLTSRLADEPPGRHRGGLKIPVLRYRCTGCGHVWLRDTSQAAEPWANLSRPGLRWGLGRTRVQHLSIARVAEMLAVSWNTANSAVPAEGKRVPIKRYIARSFLRSADSASTTLWIERSTGSLSAGSRHPLGHKGRVAATR